MSNLKELTWEHHKNAERQTFVKEMFNKKTQISDERYATFLYNQFPMYDVLESIAMMHGLFNDIPSIRRSQKIMADYKELWPHPEEIHPEVLPVVQEYVAYIRSIMTDKDKIMAHVYVRHMGDLSGGQMIRTRVPGKGTMFDFHQSIDELKEKIRDKLNDSMADEAKVCFDFATKMFQQLSKEEEA
jgi:heme oxygenase